MLDIRTIRDNLEDVAARLKVKGFELDVETFQQLDKARSAALTAAQQLQAEKKKRVNLESRLKEALTSAMNTFELEKLETPLCKISFRNSQSVEIEDVEKLPSEVIIIEKKVSKTALKELLKSGEVSGAKLVNNKSIQIK